MNRPHKSIEYVDDDRETVRTILRLRIPSLLIGLVLGIAISFVMSGFEEVIAKNIHVAFFIPFVVYIAAAVGTQTQAIYSRDLKSGKAKFFTYFHKETILGCILGIIFGGISAGIIYLWLSQTLLALSVGLAVATAVGVAPLVALITTEALQLLNEDPAAGAGPIANVIQDMMSIVIYGIICSTILL